MSASMKCPECGLVQMRRVNCKACGAVLAEPAAPGASGRMGTRRTLTWLQQRGPVQTLAWIFMGLFILVIARMVYVPKKTPSEIARRQVEEIRKRKETEMEEARSKGILDELIRRQQAERERRESEKRVIEVDPRVLSCLNAKSEAESFRQLRRVDQRIAYCESLIEIEKAGGPRLPW
jgi:hypothetical protein